MKHREQIMNANFETETEHLNRTKQKFNDVAYAQEVKGIEKYGRPLDPMDNFDWLKMALEEQVDGTKYLVAEIEKRKVVIERIRAIAERCDYQAKMEINHWLDVLEGAE